MKNEQIVILLLEILFISTVLMVRTLQRQEIEQVIINETIIKESYEPKHIGMYIERNYTTKIIKEPINNSIYK